MSGLFQIEALNAHNRLRIFHGAPPLLLCDKLTKSAEKYAKELAKIGHLQYSTKTNMGENIGCVEGGDLDGEKITQIWYDEKNKIDWSNIEKISHCNNFTQLVWIDSIKFGISKVLSKDGRIYIVARYWPPGNFLGMYTQNVLPESSTQTKRSNVQYLTKIEMPENKELRKRMIKYINRCREAHSAPTIKWDDKIAIDAGKLANYIVNNNENNSEFFRIEDMYGRIVTTCENGFFSLKHLCKSWYSCSQFYNFCNGGFSEVTGPFTQLIWKDTRSFGIGFAQSENSFVVAACFEPPGNILGRFEENIKPLASGKKCPFKEHY